MEQIQRAKRRSMILPYVVLLCGLAGTALATFLVQENLDVRQAQRFREVIFQVEETIRTRMAAYIGLLRGGAALFAANQMVTQDQFKAFYERLRIEQNYPGMQGYGYTIRFGSNRLDAITQSIRRQGITNFAVWPPEPRTEYHAIVYLEPQDSRNLNALGYDMFTEATRRAAMIRARDTGQPALSGKVRLVQEIMGPEQPGFLMYLPVYLGGNIPSTIEERQQRLQGFIYSPFRAGDLFGATFGVQLPQGIHFRIYDGHEATPDRLLYASRSYPEQPLIQEKRQFDLVGRSWTIVYGSSAEFGAVPGASLVLIVPLLGVLGSLCLFYFVRAEGHARVRSETNARQAFEQGELLQVTLASIGDAVMTTDLQGQVVFVNAVAESITGWTSAEALGKPLSEIFPIVQEQTLQPLANPAEKVLQTGRPQNLPNHTLLITRHGSMRCIDDSAAPIRDREGKLAGVVLVFREITERRRYERRITTQHSVTRILAEAPSLPEAMARVLEAICENLRFEYGVFWICDPEKNCAEASQIWHLPAEPVAQFDQACRQFKPKPGEGLPGKVWEGGQPLWVTDFVSSTAFPRAERAREAGFRSAFAFPVLLEKRVFGTLEFFSREVEKPDTDLLNVVRGLGAQIGQYIERKRAEEALQRSEELYRAISETAADGIVTIDEESRILTINAAIERIFGYARDELVGRKLHLLMPARMHQGHDAGMKRFLATGERKIPWNGVELPGLRKDAREIPLEISFGLSSSQGRHIFTGLIRDVSRRKEAERQLREAEERFALLVTQASEYAIITLNPDGRISTWNAGAERIFGYTEDQIIGQDSSVFFIEEDRKAGIPEHQLAHASTKGQVLDERWQARKDGSRFWASGVLTCLHAQDGTVRGYAKILRDITERKKSEEAVRELAQELELRVQRRTAALQESKEQMEAFTYTVAHDLRAPLRAMQGFSQALKEDYTHSLDDTGLAFLERIMASAQKMDALIQDLLAYSRLSRSDLKFRSISVRQVVDAVLAAAHSEIEESGAEIKTAIEDLYVKAHPATLEHALGNLVANSLKFTSEGLRPLIHIRAIDQGEYVQISVQDNGIGIAAEHHDRIFRVFERLHGQDEYAGTGIGLAIVKKGVERMGGRVGVASEPGSGSLFWVELPKAEKPDELDQTAEF